MVAFKEEFPYLRSESGQLFEFNREWLHAAITQAADQAGYPSWWLTISHGEHRVLSATAEGRIGRRLQPAHPDRALRSESDRLQGNRPAFQTDSAADFRLAFEVAEAAGDGYELAFFDLLEKRVAAIHRDRRDQLALFRTAAGDQTFCAEPRPGRAPATRCAKK